MPVAERFWAKVQKTDGCWLWVARNKVGRGYGRFHPSKRGVLAHRYSWELANGPIPPGLEVMHKCDTPSCVRPNHLKLGTHQDNMDDMVAKGRSPKSIGDKSGRAILSAEDVITIRARVAAGEVQRKVAADYGVAFSTICAVVKRQNWAHL